ncbi:MAG: hypothetical protein A2W95_08215 [Bacteroidetes bacterium GWA2_40_14]|nr:MAG: hypothetical protein A2W95_08215 [Bacteroidetes bacterium GWA2_40_14]
MERLKDLLSVLIERAKQFGLPTSDIRNANDFIDNQEYGLCFDIIVTQMYEYDIEIDNDFYELLIRIGDKLNIPPENYSFMKDLIK